MQLVYNKPYYLNTGLPMTTPDHAPFSYHELNETLPGNAHDLGHRLQGYLKRNQDLQIPGDLGVGTIYLANEYGSTVASPEKPIIQAAVWQPRTSERPTIQVTTNYSQHDTVIRQYFYDDYNYWVKSWMAADEAGYHPDGATPASVRIATANDLRDAYSYVVLLRPLQLLHDEAERGYRVRTRPTRMLERLMGRIVR
jgi:hypothetical protein